METGKCHETVKQKIAGESLFREDNLPSAQIVAATNCWGCVDGVEMDETQLLSSG